MKLFHSASLAVFVAAVSAAMALAQPQPVPGAKTASGQPAPVTASSPIVAPAGGVAGLGRPVAEDAGLPVVCLSGCGGGGGGGPATIADGADVAQGSVSDAPWSGVGDATVISTTKAIAAAVLATTPTHVDGPVASGVAVSGNPLGEGCRASTTTPTPVTDGQAVHAQCGVGGKRITLPYSIKELMVRGAANTTGTGATTLIAAQGASIKTYITGVQCSNTSATNTLVTFSDAAATVLIVPATGGNNAVFPVPLVTANNTAFTFTAGTGVTTLYCNAQGYAE